MGATRALRDCRRRESPLPQEMSRVAGASKSLCASMAFRSQWRRHLQSWHAIAVEDGIDLALAPVNHTLEFVAQIGISLAYSHGDRKSEGQCWRIDLGLNRREL